MIKLEEDFLMRGRWVTTGIVTALAIMGTPLSAQDADFTADRASSYEEVLDLPDWTGTWHQDWSRLFGVDVRPIQLTPEAQERQDEIVASFGDAGPPLDHVAQCVPPGVPTIMSVGGMPMEILFSPGRVTILTEAYMQVRRIFTDGRELPQDPEPFFNGNSVGHWEGDVLVVETVGLHQFNSIGRGVHVPHSEAMRVSERIWQLAADELVMEMTVSDPAVLAEPYASRIYFKRQNEFPIREYICSENNRLISGEDGVNVDLGLDDEGDPFGPPVSD